MKERLRFLLDLFKAAGSHWSEIEGPRLGAAFSYYATFAIFPLVLLGVTVIGFVVGDDASARERILAALADRTPSVRQVLEQALQAMQENRGARGVSAAIGLVSLLFGASGAFVELDSTLNRIWGVTPKKTTGVAAAIRAFVHERLAGVAILAGLALTLLASLIGSAALSAVSARAPSKLTPALAQTGELALSIVLLSGAFVLAFHFIPRSRPPVRSVVGGAVLTTALLTILKAVFASYLAKMTSYSAYGVAGGVLGLATWIYLSSQIIFFGAEITRVHCQMVGCNVAGGGSAPEPAPKAGETPAAPPRAHDWRTSAGE